MPSAKILEFPRRTQRGRGDETVEALIWMLQEARRGKLRDLGAVFWHEDGRMAALCDALNSGERDKDMCHFLREVLEHVAGTLDKSK